MVSLYELLTGEACELLAEGEEVRLASVLFGSLVACEEVESEFADYGVDSWTRFLTFATPAGSPVVWEEVESGTWRP